MAAQKLIASVTFILWLALSAYSFYFWGPYYRFFFNDPLYYTRSALFRITIITPQVWIGLYLSVWLIYAKKYRLYVWLILISLLLGGLWTFLVWYAVENS